MNKTVPIRIGSLILITEKYPFKNENFIGQHALVIGAGALIHSGTLWEYKVLVGEDYTYVMSGEFEEIKT